MSQWRKFETHPYLEAVENLTWSKRSDLHLFLFKRKCCACQDELWSCATLALDVGLLVGQLRLAKNLAGIVEWSGRNFPSWHSFSDIWNHFQMPTRRWKESFFRFFCWDVYINCYKLVHTYTDTYHIPDIPVPTKGTWACPLILQELQENKWRNLLPGAWAGSDCLQWILLKVTFAGRGKTPHAAKILPD